MVCFYQTTFQLFITVISSFAVIQGCPIVCSNGGTPFPSCKGCNCTGQWSGLYCSEPCGGRVSSLGGRITSPGFPNSYGNNENCTWVVSVPTNNTVVVSFDAMDLEWNYDFLYVYEGTTWDSELVETYTGDVLPYEMIMERSFLLIFLSDESIIRNGFSLRFQTYQGFSPKFINSGPDAHEDVTVRVGDNVTLRCNAFAVPIPDLSWSKDGVEMVQDSWTSVYLHGQELVIVNVHVSDAAWYTCEAGNYLGTFRRSYQLIVQAPPTIIHGPTSIHFDRLNDEQQAVFRCDVFGIPKPQVTWKKNGIPFNGQFVEGTGWLKIRRVALNDVGNYSCYANNTLGDVETNTVVLAIINTTAYSFYAGSLQAWPSVNVNATVSFGLMCYACFPELDLALYKNSSNLNASTNPRFSIQRHFYGYILYYSSVTEKDMGIYEIRLLPQRLSWYVAINVQVPPTVVIPRSGIILRSFRERLTISCESKAANPKPSFVWKRDGLQVDNAWTGHIIKFGYDKSYLTLTEDADQQQTVEYSCTATNAAGTSTARVNIAVRSSNGWIESNRGSQCSSSCNSDYGLFLVQRKCVSNTHCFRHCLYIAGKGCSVRCIPDTRCSGLSVYSTVCSSFRTNCTADESDTTRGRNTGCPSISDTEQGQGNKKGLSPGAAAGVSVLATAIVAALSFAALWYFVNGLRRNSQHKASEDTAPVNGCNTSQFRSRSGQKFKFKRESVDMPLGRFTQTSSSSRGTAVEAESGETETKQIYDIAYAPEEMNDSPAYVSMTVERQIVNGVSNSDHVYDETCL